MPHGGEPGCHFCRALQGREDGEPRAFDDGQFVVFMGRYQPTGPGYALVVPHVHIPDLHSLSESECGQALHLVGRVSAAIISAFDVTGTTVIENNGRPGQSVMHLHFHVVPRWEGDGYPRRSEKPESDSVLTEQAARLAAVLDSSTGRSRSLSRPRGR
jgi:histidine triad (HIT) family protein